MAHIDIISNNTLYSRAYSGMKTQTKHGNAIILILICAFISIFAAFCLRFYIWKMKIEGTVYEIILLYIYYVYDISIFPKTDFRLKCNESETSSHLN